MNLRVLLPYVLLPLGLITTLCGCVGGDSLPRQEVSGKVTLGGQPLDVGSIEFQPEASAGGPVVPGGALIATGTYRLAREQGLVPGTYKVMIFSHGARTGSSSDPGAQTAPPPERIPARYNVSTTLKAEVAKDRPNVFNFEITE
jgi:hypothetical protein